MRTIKFRGKDKQGEWQEGHLLVYLGIHYILTPIWETYRNEYVETDRSEEHEVDSKTIGQFIGLHDKNGNEIYEGDIVKMSTAMYGDEIFRVGYEDSHIGAFCLCSDEQEDTSRFVSIFGTNYGYEPFYCTVIGNIHDNPELLKGGEK